MPVSVFMPDYYPRFSCKGGACRATCCRGWGISVSLAEYFALLSLDCSPSLRRSLDGAFHPAEDPSPERYALITPRFDGDCPLHLENGWCGLQTECGEKALPAICCRYPRGIHLRGGIYECCMANSCERTLELLFQNPAPVSVLHQEWPLEAPLPTEALDDHNKPFYLSMRKSILDLLSDRSFTLPKRIGQIGMALSRAMDAHSSFDVADGLPDRATDSISGPLSIQHALLSLLEETSPSLALEEPLIDRSLRLEKSGETSERSVRLYKENAARLERILPEHERYFEQMLFNHIFFEGFPFADQKMDFSHAYGALCACYALLRLIAVGGMVGRDSLDDFIDLMARAFRALEHSRFDWNAAVILEKNGWMDNGTLSALLYA